MQLSREERVEVAAKLVESVHAFTAAAAAWTGLIEERVRRAPGAFGRHTALPDSLGVRRVFLRNFPYTMTYLHLDGELMVLAVAHQYRLPEQEDITITALVEVEDWIAANGLRAFALLVAASLAQ